jgi:hypothetical protein
VTAATTLRVARRRSRMRAARSVAGRDPFMAPGEMPSMKPLNLCCLALVVMPALTVRRFSASTQ